MTLTNEPRSSIVGTLSRKRADYDVWSIQSDQNIDGGDMERPTIGGEEVLDLTCLLPRSKKGGKLFFGKPYFPFKVHFDTNTCFLQHPNLFRDI